MLKSFSFNSLAYLSLSSGLNICTVEFEPEKVLISKYSCLYDFILFLVLNSMRLLPSIFIFSMCLAYRDLSFLNNLT